MARRRQQRGSTIQRTQRQYEPPDRSSYETAYDVQDQFFNDDGGQIIPDWLDPIGDSGFFMTPEEPADPTDCERYPNSPWCGGTGIDIDSVFDISPATIEPSISASGCEICLRIESSLFWISLPDNYICYRSKDPSCQPIPDPDPPPPPTPTPGGSVGPFTPTPGNFPPGSNCKVITQTRSRFFTNPFTSWQFKHESWGYPSGYYKVVTDSGVSASGEFFENFYHAWYGVRVFGGPIELVFEMGFYNNNTFYEFRHYPKENGCIDRTPPSNVPPNYPPPYRDPCCMACCPSQKDNQEILDLLKRLSRRLGTGDYPIKTPQWLVSNQGNATATHESLTQFNFWLMRQIDALIGEFPIRIQIQDSDPTEKGAQTKTINLPNLAEAVAEIYGLAAKTSIDSDVHTSFLIRLAAETMAAKTAALIAQDYASANASYLGYQGNQVARKVNFAFDPTELDSLETILKASQQDIIGWKNDDKENVAAYLQKLMFSAGLLKTVFFRKGNDLTRVLKEVAQFMPDPEAEESEGWKEFMRLINDPESVENKGTDIKPEIKNVSQKQGGGGS